MTYPRSMAAYRQLATIVLLAVAAEIASAQNKAPTQLNPEGLLEQAVARSEQGDHAGAIELATSALKQDPSAADAYYVRARERFCSGKIRESLADFDQFIALRPELAARQWERGIACYYAGEYAAGAKQFELYQKYDGQDVENSVWRYLCLVPQVGTAGAAATMLPIQHDPRVPMMEVYDLYRGRAKPEEVLAAVRAGDPAQEVLAARLFYAHLYLGLWYDAQGDQRQAAHYIALAASPKLRGIRGINRYMWDVARIHDQKLRGELPAAKPAK